MTTNIFKTLRDRYQIPDNIPICLLKKFEKCYSGKIANVGMYDVMFIIGLRLPLTTLHCQLATFLGLSVSQVAPNAWRIFIGTEILWGHLSGRNRQLTLDEFFWCYIPQHISTSKVIYHFATRKKSLRLVSNMPTLIEIGRVDIFSFKRRTRYAIEKNGWQCLMALTILGVSSKIQV